MTSRNYSRHQRDEWLRTNVSRLKTESRTVETPGRDEKGHFKAETQSKEQAS